MKNMNQRGLTLVELLVTMAIASVIVLAVMASGVTMMVYTRKQGQRAAAEATLSIALAQLELRASNAGVNFSNAKYAVRVRNNVSASHALSNYASNITVPVVARGGAAAGIVEGTDVLELAMSPSGIRRAGMVASPRVGNTVTIRNGDPFLDSELAATNMGRVVLFTDPMRPQDACLGRLQSATADAAPQLTIAFVNDDMNTVSTGPACSTLPSAACPCRADANAFVLEQRVRIVVYQQGNGDEMGLYLQDPAANGSFASTFTPLAIGVENMQISPEIGPLLDGSALTVGTCTATGTIGITWNRCECNRFPPGSNTAPCTIGTSGAARQDAEAYVRSLSIELTARADQNPNGRLPASFDSPEGAVDGRDRIQAITTVDLRNPYLVIH